MEHGKAFLMTGQLWAAGCQGKSQAQRPGMSRRGDLGLIRRAAFAL
jgi:hypothetical protein